MENMGLGLQLMVVGMATVFLILYIVIQLGKILIKIVNKYIPAEDNVSKEKTPATVQAIDAETMTVIREAIKNITAGKGHATKVERV